MDFSFISCFEAVILSSSLSLDAFAAAFAYGCAGVKIPFKSVQVINFTCSFMLGLSLFAGMFIRRFIPEQSGAAACFVILLAIGVFKLAQDLFKKKNAENTAEPKTIGAAEAVILAAGLSLDGLAVGFGAALGQSNAVVMVAASLISDTAAVMLGCFAGGKLAKKAKLNVSWLGGVIIIILAVSRIFL